ncbi:Uncharacterised protein [Vibrio cholerae]|nr:Uncharacterised protein [Vibrio cholerae]CSB24014.1 Uncharacterised protein [Vibrio cholerae]CSC45966.1 Uncharacterised protein [Vibrio cholerae]
MIRWPLTTNTHVFSSARCRINRHFQHDFYRRIAFIKQMSYIARITIQS